MKGAKLLPLLAAFIAANPLVSTVEQDTQIPITPTPPTGDPVASIPPLGLGLWNSWNNLATSSVLSAFHDNYTHLDGAAAYYNEKFVGRALSKPSSPPRHKYWLTSKLWNKFHRPRLVPIAFNRTLSDLNTTYLDLYLMHWPVAFLPHAPRGRTIIDEDTPITETWRAMEALASAYQTSNGTYGARYIGVSNFSPRQLDAILDMCTICPYAHEFEAHPYLQQQEFVSWHQQHDIKVISYSPLANLNPVYKHVMPGLPPILEDPFWTALAERKNVTVAQAILGWGISRGTAVIPKSTHESRILENHGALDVRFNETELAEIAVQDKKIRFNNPSKSWGVELFEGLDDGSSRFLLENHVDDGRGWEL